MKITDNNILLIIIYYVKKINVTFYCSGKVVLPKNYTTVLQTVGAVWYNIRKFSLSFVIDSCCPCGLQ